MIKVQNNEFSNADSLCDLEQVTLQYNLDTEILPLKMSRLLA